MATRRPVWKWHIWKSIGFFPYTLVMCYWSLDLMFKAKQKLESGNRKIQDCRQAAILKVTSLKINRLLPMATSNMHMKFEIEILKQTWVTPRKPCRLQTDGQTQTDRRTRWIQYTPHPPTPPPTNFVGRGHNEEKMQRRWDEDFAVTGIGDEHMGMLVMRIYVKVLPSISDLMWYLWSVYSSYLIQQWCVMAPVL